MRVIVASVVQGTFSLHDLEPLRGVEVSVSEEIFQTRRSIPDY